MDTFKKNSIILIDYVDLNSIDTSLLERCDRIAMTPGAMLAFEEKGLSYFSFGDFYDFRQFRGTSSEFVKSIEDLLSKLDNKYKSFLDFPYAFTGNILWFRTFFSNIYYISRICEKITKNYDRVYLVGNLAYQSSFKIDLQFSLDGLAFHKCNRGLVNRVNMLRACLSPECIWFNSIHTRRLISSVNRKRLIGSLKRILKEALSKSETFLARWVWKGRGEGVIFIIQDGYEVSLLKRYMTGFRYINPVDRLLRMARNKNTKRLNLNPLFAKELKEFIEKWFPHFEGQIFELFTLYHNRILCRLPSFIENLKETFEYNKPVALFYSIFANRVYEGVCAYFANRKNVPVFYFQHGGTNAFVIYPIQKYMEQNETIDKINIFQSKIEKELSMRNISANSQALGSIRLYNLYTRHKEDISRQSRKDILYCARPFSLYNYRNFTVDISDKEPFEMNKDIVDIVSKFDLELTIKVHPNDEIYNYLYFKNLLKVKQCKTITILKGVLAERIIENYGLLILDYIGTALLPVALILDIPVIIYLKDIPRLRKETTPDFEKRFYLARSKSDLERYISLYAQGKLESKFSLEIVDKYAFPLDAGNPAINISNYIQEKILK